MEQARAAQASGCTVTVRRDDTPRGPRIVVPLGGVDHVLSIESATELRDGLIAELAGDDLSVGEYVRWETPNHRWIEGEIAAVRKTGNSWSEISIRVSACGNCASDRIEPGELVEVDSIWCRRIERAQRLAELAGGRA